MGMAGLLIAVLSVSPEGIISGTIAPYAVRESYAIRERESVHWLEYRIPGGIGNRVEFTWSCGLISKAETDNQQPERGLFWYDENRTSCVYRTTDDSRSVRLFLRFHGPVPNDWKRCIIHYSGIRRHAVYLLAERFGDEMFAIRGFVRCSYYYHENDSLSVVVAVAEERLDKATIQLRVLRLAVEYGVTIDRFETQDGYPNHAEGAE